MRGWAARLLRLGEAEFRRRRFRSLSGRVKRDAEPLSQAEMSLCRHNLLEISRRLRTARRFGTAVEYNGQIVPTVIEIVELLS